MSGFRRRLMMSVKGTSQEINPIITWSVQAGSWTEGTNSSSYDGKQFTSVSPGSNGSTVIRCTFSGVTEITFNCVYNGENNYDYLTIGALDTACTRTSYGTSLKGTSGTAKDITFTCDTEEHYVEFCYSKDSSVDTSPDCAVVYLKSLVAGSGSVTPDNPSTDLKGVYIQAVDGSLFTKSAWDGSLTPNGIAVITDNCRFVMALTDAHTSACKWGGYGTTVSGITTTTDFSTAMTDYDGEAQTTTLISALTGTTDGYVNGAPAAEYCRAYTFPNGATGYMGAAGEWQAVLNNKPAVASALSACGGTAMSDWYWTSTQNSSDLGWCIDWTNENFNNDSKRTNNYVRAFAALESGEGDSGSGLEFPLYLEFDSCESDKYGTICVRQPDETSIKLRDYLIQIAIEYGASHENVYTVTEQILALLGVEFYIDSQKALYYTYNTQRINIYMQSVYDVVNFREDGTLYFEGVL